MPYELLNKKFRAGQKAVDREVNQVTSVCSDLIGILGQPTTTAGEVEALLEVMDHRLLSLKRKVRRVLKLINCRLSTPFPLSRVNYFVNCTFI